MMAEAGLQRALDALSERLHADVDRQVRAALQELSQATLSAPTKQAVVAEPADAARSERLVAAIQSVSEGRSLTEILDRLATAASAEASRVAVLLVRGDRVRSWRLAGFDATEPLDLSLETAGIVEDAVRGKSAVADTFGDRTPAFAAGASGIECIAVPITLSGEVVAVLYADGGLANPEPGTRNPEPLEILARYSARCLEVLTAFKVARSVAAPDAVVSRPQQDPSDAEIAARRYARLLVSEIKLYHEPDVIAGRQEGSLMARLGGEIARARSLYEQRVAAAVRERADYFQEEVVRTLANGDPALLVAGEDKGSGKGLRAEG
jgi:hypothetical protein